MQVDVERTTPFDADVDTRWLQRIAPKQPCFASQEKLHHALHLLCRLSAHRLRYHLVPPLTTKLWRLQRHALPSLTIKL